MTEMKPFWRYYGGKYRVAARYPAPLPGRPIVEPFAGAAGYSTRFGAYREVILCEKDPKIAAIWRWLISANPSDVMDIPSIRPDGSVEDLVGFPDAVKWLVGFWLNQGASQPGRVPSAFAKDPKNGGWSDKSRARVAAQVPMIREWVVYEGSCTEILPHIVATWFVDPPYQTAAGRHYKHSDVDYASLGRWCLNRKGRVIACDQEGADWLPFQPFGHVQPTPGKHRSGQNDEVFYTHDSFHALVSGLDDVDP